MLISLAIAPVNNAHASLCDYGHLFTLFVPGDTGNPFVAVWQADLVQTVVLLVGGLVLLAINHALAERGKGWARYLGYALPASAAASAILTGVTVVSSHPLVCGGVPGAPPMTGAAEQAFQVFQTLNMLSTFMLYLTLLLVIALIFAVVVLAVSRLRAWIRRAGGAR